MVTHIRPHKLHQLVETDSSVDRVIKVVLPGKLHTPVLLETVNIITLAKVVKATTFLEIGTLVGVQTLNIAMNLPKSCRVYTLDLDKDSFARIKDSQHQNDLWGSEMHLQYGSKLAFLDTPYEERITRLYGDSKEYDFSDLEGQMDMIWIDGGHDLATVKSDTENSFKLLSPNSMSCIAWHDYNSSHYPDLTDYLDKLSNEIRIFHVEESMTCFYIKNAPESLIDKLS